MKRLIYILLAFTLLVATFSVNVLALDTEGSDATGIQTQPTNIAEDEKSSDTDTAIVDEKSNTVSTEEEEKSATESGLENENSENTEENFFEIIYNELSLHIDKILAVLTFVGSLIIAFAYKKGLIPVIQTALTSMGTRVVELKESTEKSMGIASDSIVKVTEKLESAEQLITSLSDKLARLEKELDASKKDKEERAMFNTILLTQVEMLYDVFTSSSLPTYQKEIVGEKIAEMKKALSSLNSEA